MSAAQSTSMPIFRMTSARNSRFAVEVSTSRTRFFFGPPGIGAADGGVNMVVVMLTPMNLWSFLACFELGI
jgi:hypothetical protein